MKKIGFIDHYIDEPHANEFLRLIRAGSHAGTVDVVLALEETTLEGRRSVDQWCREQSVERAIRVEQIVEQCDYIALLAPNNPERHEELADLPLRSGKPVYIDKAFAPSVVAAQRLFAKAKAHGTPLMSSSALRYAPALHNVVRKTVGQQPMHFVGARGPGEWGRYAIHQIEMLVALLGTGATRVMSCGVSPVNLVVVDYPSSRRGSIQQIPGHAFQLSVQYGEDRSVVANEISDFFPPLVQAMLRFFETGICEIPEPETLEVMAILEAGATALDQPDTWVDTPNYLGGR